MIETSLFLPRHLLLSDHKSIPCIHVISFENHSLLAYLNKLLIIHLGVTKKHNVILAEFY